ncbi:hypothetical protein GE09DRAFT_1061325 [Coniochaeta sp. 2T2.1]|nr:hypothetical protein GE09DRAFT_1061325 [Coniochaeta sp. 2T2.1]
MPTLTRRTSSSQKSTSSRDSGRSRRSKDSYGSQSTAPSSIYASSRPSDVKASRSSGSTGSYASATSRPKQQYQQQQPQYTYGCEDVSPGTSHYARSSVDTHASTTASEGELVELDFMDNEEYSSIPPLPMYTRDIVEPNVRPSSPQEFAKLFPSLNRLSIRHDEYTPDGNMNLRIDTVVTGRRRTVIQLFHLRMYDLAKREFSLRRYCRDSGREVCNSKRKYIEPAEPKSIKRAEDDPRPNLQRSMSTALKSLSGGGNSTKPGIRRTNSGGSFFSSKSSTKSSNKHRPSSSTSSSTSSNDSSYFPSLESLHSSSHSSKSKPKSHKKEPTNTIKLEFSNYARVDIHRRGKSKSKRYDFEWWGHRYAWKRSIDPNLGLVSFHLLRDGDASSPVAHIVPETRSPSQVLADESAGGWVPPCFMWIADESVLDAVTDVADVIMATGLMALVDDCIKDRWQPAKKVHRIPVPLTHKTVDMVPKSPKSILQQVFFGRRNSKENQQHEYQYYSKPSTPLRYANPISAY